MARKACWAGKFYDSTPADLRAGVEGLLSDADGGEPRPLFGLIVPHAGYIYSGATAASGFSRINHEHYDRVLLLGPSHRRPFRGLALCGHESWETPLGSVAIDSGVRDELLTGTALFSINDEAHAVEHSLEVQIPLLQIQAPGLPILPVLTGALSPSEIGATAQALLAALPERTLWIVSTDLSHFHAVDEAEIMDSHLAELIAEADVDGLQRGFAQGRIEACGAVALMIALKAARSRGCRVEVLHRCDSAAVSGDRESVVGYLAAAIFEAV